MLSRSISKKKKLEYFDYKHDLHLNILKLRKTVEKVFVKWEEADNFTKYRTFYRKYKWNKYLLKKL